MRVLIAPDAFTGTLSAVEAARAIADGWATRAPADTLDLAPMADGGPGFVGVLHAALGGALHAVTVRGPVGDPVPATLLLVERGGARTAYVESAQACGLSLVGDADPEAVSSAGVGDLVVAAWEAGATEIVVGLGGSGTTDGGAGMLAALGATADVPLDRGVAGLRGVSAVDLEPARRRLSGARLVGAVDLDIPLTGLFGTVKTSGEERGLPAERLPAVDGVLEEWALATDRARSLEKGAGAAGGLGFAVALLDGERTPGLDLVAGAVRLAERARQADLVLTGEGAFDFSSRSGKVPYGVAEVAAAALRPCVALAGQVLVGAREMRTLGIESAYSVVDLVGEDQAFADPAGSLSRLAERVARTWSRG